MRSILPFFAALVLTALAGCRSAPVRDALPEPAPTARAASDLARDAAESPTSPSAPAANGSAGAPAAAPPRAEIQLGSAEFVNRAAAERPRGGEAAQGEVTFNWENVPLQEVVKAILGDLLQENYVIAPGVQGSVTFATSKPISADQAMGVLEMLLAWNNATLVHTNGRWTVLPIAQALPGNLTPRIGPADAARGYEVRVVPLQFISATEMEKLLKPYAKPGAVVLADNARSMLVLAGNAAELRTYLDTVEIFDVDWLAGMSVGIFPLERVEAKTVVPELEKVFGEGGATPLAGMFRFLPIERMNAVLVITPQPKYLAEAEKWLVRLDRGGSDAGSQLFVYYVKNVKATDLSEKLSEIFTGKRSGSGSGGSRAQVGAVVPGIGSVEISSLNAGRGDAQGAQEAKVVESPLQQAGASGVAASGGGFGGDGIAIVESENIRISAIEESNALLIRSTPREYDSILAAIKRLDTVPLQVHIEAKVLQVDLTNNLSFGVRWFFENSFSSSDSRDFRTRVRGFGSANEQGSTWNSFAGTVTGTGLNWTFLNTSAEALVAAIQSQGNIQVLSAPSLVVLNNKEANINVGKQIPVVSTFFSGVNSGTDGGTINPNINQSYVQFRDTGVILSVTPRVNPGGLVFLEIKQEKSTPGEQSEAVAGNVPVNKSTIETEIAVQSGQTVMLGGLISDQVSTSEGGVPLLHKIPVVGKLFGTTTKDRVRQELLVLITPTVIANSEDARVLTDEYRRQFEGLEPLQRELGSAVQRARATEAARGEGEAGFDDTPAPEPAPEPEVDARAEPDTDPDDGAE